MIGSPQTEVVSARRKFQITPGAAAAGAVLALLLVVSVVILITTSYRWPMPMPFPMVIPTLHFGILFFVLSNKSRLIAVGPNGYTSFVGPFSKRNAKLSSAPSKVIGFSPSLQFNGKYEVELAGETLGLGMGEAARLQSAIDQLSYVPPPPG